MNTSPSRTRMLGFALAALGMVLSASARGQSRFSTIRDDMSPVIARNRVLGHADPGQVLHVNVSLKSPNAAALKAFVDDVSDPSSPNYRHFLTPAEVGAKFGPPAAAVQSVKNYLESQGFKIKLIGKSGLNIMADGTVNQAEKAFNTKINQYKSLESRDTGRPVFFANAKPVQAPAEIASHILTVTGLQNYSRPKPALITINQAQTLYGTAKAFSAGMYGQGRTLAYSNYDGYRVSNLPLYYSAYSLPAPAGGVGSNVSIVTIDGGAGTGTANGEGDLDMQMILGMAPQCNLIIYDGSQNATDVLTQEQDDNKADVITESYGWGFPPADEDANHQIHLMMSAQGITYLCASGDDGTSYLNEDQAVYPDIDPDVLVVGGTIATTDSTGNRISETAWPNGAGGYTNDGAACNALPAYQKLGTPGIPTNIPYRLLPDVAMNAGGSGSQGAAFPFYWNGQLTAYGSGTSFSSPLFAGGLGIAEQKLVSLGLLSPDKNGKYRFGRINDLFYSQNLRSDVWFDVTSGSNGSLLNGSTSNAGVGWDTATGLGAINFDGFVSSFGGSGGVSVSLSVSPTTVIEGSNAIGTITLSTAAGTGGAVVSLSASDPSLVGVPTSITIPSGGSTGTFTITTSLNPTAYISTITASYQGQSALAALSVNAESIASLTLSPVTINGGQTTNGTITLLTAAPSGGWVVNLASSDPGYVSIPNSITVPAGATTATFTATSKTYVANYTSTITASDAESTQSATLTVLNDSLSTLALSPPSVVGGGTSIGIVSMTGPAPAGGVTLALASSNSNATLPASVTIPAGSTSASFTISTSGLTSPLNVTITATYNGASKTATLTIEPISLASVTISPTSVIGGNSAVGTVNLNGPAPSAGVTVSLSSNLPYATVPTSVSIPSGATSATFTVNTKAAPATVTAVVTAVTGSISKAASLTIGASALQTLTLSPSVIVGGSQTTAMGTVVFNGLAGSSGATVTLTSSNPRVASVPAQITIPNGSSSASFTITHFVVAAGQTVTIKATCQGIAETASLIVNPFAITKLSISPTVVAGGNNVPGTVTLNAPAGQRSGPILVKLSSTSKAITYPASVMVLVGSSTATFTIGTKAQTATTTATVVGTLSSSSLQASLTIQAPALLSVSVSPTSIKGSSTTLVKGTVTLTGPAPAGGAVVALKSSDTAAASTPTTVVIAAGKTSATFTVTHKKVTAQANVSITATWSNSLVASTLTVTP